MRNATGLFVLVVVLAATFAVTAGAGAATPPATATAATAPSTPPPAPSAGGSVAVAAAADTAPELILGGSCATPGALKPASYFSWLASVGGGGPIGGQPSPTACGDCPGSCLSTAACTGVVGDSCTSAGHSGECTAAGSCAKYVCCSCS